MNCLLFWILELVLFTLFMKVSKMQKKQVNGILEKFLSLGLQFFWTFLPEDKPLKKPLSLIFIHCHIVVIDGTRVKTVYTVLLKYGHQYIC